MNWQPKQDFYSITDYLKNELESDCKHEYLNGDVYAMAGASISHQRVIANLMRLLGNQLRGTPCEPLASDTKVKISDLAVFYPDVMVVCDPMDNPYYTETPLIIVEVLSKSTRRKDETTKRRLYQSLPSLQEYVLIEQDIVDIEVCRRSEGWQPEHYFMGDDISFVAIDLTVSVNEIYERVENEDVRTFFETAITNPQ